MEWIVRMVLRRHLRRLERKTAGPYDERVSRQLDCVRWLVEQTAGKGSEGGRSWTML